MKTWTRMAVLAVLTLIATAALAVPANLSGDRDSQRQVTPGRWTLSAGPYFGPGHESLPVDVYSVTTNADRGHTVTQVKLNNRTAKDAVAVNLHWYLRDGDSGRLLLEGDTPLIELALPAGQRRTLEYPVISFGRIARSLLKERDFSGNFRIEVVAGQVVYADGSSAAGVRRDLSFIPAAFGPKPSLYSGCSKQRCEWSNDHESYRCLDSTNSESCMNQGSSCTNERCAGELQ